MRKIFMFVSPFLLLSACMSEDDATKLSLICDLGEDTADTYEMVRLGVSSYSLDGLLTRMSIKSFDSSRGEIVLKDTALDVREIDYTYIYRVPLLESDTSSVELSVTMEDNTGETQMARKKLVVIKKDRVLEELSGIIMYQNSQGMRPDGFSLKSLQPVVTETADSADIDIYAYGTDGLFGREWRTNTDITFVKADNFDYPNATSSSVEETFRASVGQHNVTGIDDDDVIIIGCGHEAKGVVRIMFAVDEGADSRYIFNLKPVR